MPAVESIVRRARSVRIPPTVATRTPATRPAETIVSRNHACTSSATLLSVIISNSSALCSSGSNGVIVGT